jgi:dTDP-glucose pyrophosphorylase/CBS domain-containing protein
MIKKELHIISQSASIRYAMERLTALGENLTLFVINDNDQLVGVITDGDIRRGLIRGISIEDAVKKIMNTNFKYLQENKFSFDVVVGLKESSVKVIPMIDESFKIKRVVNIAAIKSLLPVDAVLMAGGRGERLMPLTANKPKPMLEINGKPILERNIDLLSSYGVHNIYISVFYLADQIISHFGDGAKRGLDIGYLEETKPLGTLGAAGMLKDLKHDDVIVMNSDLLTNINFEDFFKTFKEEDADMAIATTSYNVTVPYAVLETNNGIVHSFREKPTYTYFSNAGIYLIKRKYIEMIQEGSFYNATDMVSDLINNGKKVITYPILGYWLDIGRHEDYAKAQEDIKHMIF